MSVAVFESHQLHSFSGTDTDRIAYLSWDLLIEGWPLTRKELSNHVMNRTLPPQVRTKLWMTVSGADALCRQSPKLYSTLLQKTCPVETDRKIQKDLHRTFGGTLCLPSTQTPEVTIQSLHNVLRAVCLYDKNPQSSYCQGINYIAATLLCQMTPEVPQGQWADSTIGGRVEAWDCSQESQHSREEKAFWLLVVLLYHRHVVWLYRTDVPFLHEFIECFSTAMKMHLPTLHAHFAQSEFLASTFALEWFTCLFSFTHSFNTAQNVLDMIFIDVNDALFRVGLALLKLSEDKLLKMSFEELMVGFRECVQYPPETLMKCVQLFELKTNTLLRLHHQVGLRVVSVGEPDTPTWANVDGHFPPRLLDALKRSAMLSVSECRAVFEAHLEGIGAVMGTRATQQLAAEMLFRACFWDAAVPALALLQGRLCDAHIRLKPPQQNTNESNSGSDNLSPTPLHICALRNSVAVARILLLFGASPQTKAVVRLNSGKRIATKQTPNSNSSANGGGNSPCGTTVSLTPAQIADWVGDGVPRQSLQKVFAHKVCLHCDRLFENLKQGVQRRRCKSCSYYFCQRTSGVIDMSEDCLSLHHCPKDDGDVGSFRCKQTLLVTDLLANDKAGDDDAEFDDLLNEINNNGSSFVESLPNNMPPPLKAPQTPTFGNTPATTPASVPASLPVDSLADSFVSLDAQQPWDTSQRLAYANPNPLSTDDLISVNLDSPPLNGNTPSQPPSPVSLSPIQRRAATQHGESFSSAIPPLLVGTPNPTPPLRVATMDTDDQSFEDDSTFDIGRIVPEHPDPHHFPSGGYSSRLSRGGSSLIRRQSVAWQSDMNVWRCALCNAAFSMILRRHHCRRCRLIFCSSCAGVSCTLPPVYTSKVRVCSNCNHFLRQCGCSWVDAGTPLTAVSCDHRPWDFASDNICFCGRCNV